jgi:phosphoenolpyruvate-protein kinase (PTS system EI component)
MSIPSIAAIKAGLRKMSMATAKDLAARALACSHAEEVRKLPLYVRKGAQ